MRELILEAEVIPADEPHVDGSAAGSLPAWLSGATVSYRQTDGPDLLGRWQAHLDWSDSRCVHECGAPCKSENVNIVVASIMQPTAEYL